MYVYQLQCNLIGDYYCCLSIIHSLMIYLSIVVAKFTIYDIIQQNEQYFKHQKDRKYQIDEHKYFNVYQLIVF